MRILIAGFSTRAIAESALKSGADILTLDYFGDSDQRAFVVNRSLLRDYHLPFSAQGLLQASHGLSADGLVYISSLENHPDIVRRMAEGRVLLGNAPDTLRRVRDWRLLRRALDASGFAFPITLLPGEELRADARRRWLVKPIASGGGQGVGWWSGEPLREEQLLQEFIEGFPASVSFVANGRRAVMLGLSEQLIGANELGAGGFTWCGNILPAYLDQDERSRLLQTLQGLIGLLTAHFGLRGLNGLDLVIATDPEGALIPYLIEVNPRYTASMELIESVYGLNVFALHLEAIKGSLPKFALCDTRDGAFCGKAVVFADVDQQMPDTGHWLTKGRRDIPFSGERIQSGHPICTVLAEGKTRDRCWEALLKAARSVRTDISSTCRVAA